MEGHAGQATDARAGNAPRRPVASTRRALARLLPGNETGRHRDPLPPTASPSPRARAATVRALLEERRAGTLNSPERIERAAERLLGG